jgi:hypothetical protein
MRIVIAVVTPDFEGKYPWKNGDPLLLLGEVENAPDHVAVADKAGRVHWIFDRDSFREATEDEI